MAKISIEDINEAKENGIWWWETGAGKKYYLGEVFKNINNKYFTYLGNNTFIVHKP